MKLLSIGLIFVLAILQAACNRETEPKTSPQDEERWLNYNIHLQFQEDSSAIIDEVRKLYVTGKQIKHGFAEGFPLDRVNPVPSASPITVEVLNILRDGFSLDKVETPISADTVEVMIGDKTELPKGQYQYVIRYRLKNLVYEKDAKKRMMWRFLENNTLRVDSFNIEISFENKITGATPILLLYDTTKSPPEKKSSYSPTETANNIIRYNLGSIPAQHFLELQLQWDKAVDGK